MPELKVIFLDQKQLHSLLFDWTGVLRIVCTEESRIHFYPCGVMAKREKNDRF